MAIMDTQEQSNLPSSSSEAQKSTAAFGTDVISGLLEAGSQADIAARQATAAANVPMPGGHMMPQNAMLPGGGMQHEQLPFNTNEAVGHRQAMQRGIVNATTGVANLVSAVSQQVEQKQTQRLAVNMERLMGATQSMDQAQAVLKANPNDQNAKEQADRASKIMDEILSDDKTRKSIQKAYNINFTDPSKNNTKEHAALKQATDSYAKQFERQLPTQMQPNVAAQEQAKLAQAQAQAVHKTIDAVLPAILRGQAGIEEGKIRAQTQKEVELGREEAAWKRLNSQEEEAMKRTKFIQNSAYGRLKETIKHTDARAEEQRKLRRELYGGIGGMPRGALEKEIADLNKTVTTYEKTWKDAVNKRDHAKKYMKKEGITEQNLQDMNQGIYMLEQQHKVNQQRLALYQDELDRRLRGEPAGQSDTDDKDSTPPDSGIQPTGDTETPEPEHNPETYDPQ